VGPQLQHNDTAVSGGQAHSTLSLALHGLQSLLHVHDLLVMTNCRPASLYLCSQHCIAAATLADRDMQLVIFVVLQAWLRFCLH
jgi:hypothetical protein